MKVKDLRKALEDLPDNLVVVIEVESDKPGSAYTGVSGISPGLHWDDGKLFIKANRQLQVL